MAKEKTNYALKVSLTQAGRQKVNELVARVGFFKHITQMVRDALRIYDIITEIVFVKGNELLVRDKKAGTLEKLVLWEGPPADHTRH